MRIPVTPHVPLLERCAGVRATPPDGPLGLGVAPLAEICDSRGGGLSAAPREPAVAPSGAPAGIDFGAPFDYPVAAVESPGIALLAPDPGPLRPRANLNEP